MGLTKHLAVADVRATTFAPGGDMVGIHFGQLPDPCTVGVMADGAVMDNLKCPFRRLSPFVPRRRISS